MSLDCTFGGGGGHQKTYNVFVRLMM